MEVKDKRTILNYPQKNRALAVILSGMVKSKNEEPIYGPPHVLALEELQETGYFFHNVSLMLIG